MVLLLLLLTPTQLHGPADAPAWPASRPESVGLTQGQIDTALQEWSERTGPDGVSRTAIVCRGKLVHAGPASKTPSGLYSTTKSFTSTCLGLLIEDGVVTLDTRAAELEPTLADLYPDATLRHFTTMTSGYSAAGRSRWDDENSDWSWTPYDPTTPHFPPGTHYAYWDEAQMTLGRLLTIAAKQDLLELLDSRVLTPIECTTQSWDAEGEVDGVPVRNGCTWLTLSAEDLARYGQLFLDEGRWDGRQLIPTSWVRAATRVQVSRETPVGNTDRKNVVGSGCYGFNWWVNGTRPDGTRLLPDLPDRAFYSAGLKHNVCLVIPEWRLVMVRLGEDHNPTDGHAAVLNDAARLLQPKSLTDIN